ncbi:hypothetical protein K9M50_02160 [Patescibacteria group bacterium]|nr:hypothetical protein [Patescibacteria group bacterium]
MKKRIISTIGILSLLGAILVFQAAETKNVDYYSGDAIYHNNSLYITTANSGSLEVFKLSNNKLDRIDSVKAINDRFNTKEDFNDSSFKVIRGNLYVYGVSKYSLYRYEVNTDNLSLDRKLKNNIWEWYNRVDVFGDYLVTISPKGVKEWNNDMQVVNAYDVINSRSYNVDSADSKHYIFNQTESKIKVYNKKIRSYISELTLNYKKDENRQVYFDSENDKIFAVDDFYTKKFNLSGELEGSFRHLDYTGYDVKSSANGYIYFSNGVGIVKLRASDMSEVDYTYTTHLGEPGGWAMGLEVVNTSSGDNVVLFNNSNILILDANLNKITSVKAGVNDKPEIVEDLFLRLDRNSAASNSKIQISGGGFAANEKLEIKFKKDKYSVKANNLGRFENIITVPETRKPEKSDIRVEGQESGLHYSISFNIE